MKAVIFWVKYQLSLNDITNFGNILFFSKLMCFSKFDLVSALILYRSIYIKIDIAIFFRQKSLGSFEVKSDNFERKLLIFEIIKKIYWP